MKNLKRILILTIVIIFLAGMLCAYAVEPIHATKYKNKNSITVKVKDGKKTIKVKCTYKKSLKQYTGLKKTKNKKYQYSSWISYSKTNKCQSGKKGWSTSVAKDDLTKKYGDGYKCGFSNNQHHPVTTIKIKRV